MGPFAEGNYGIFENETLKEIALKYNKTIAQVILRWNIQRNVIVIPKSVHKNRIEENMNIWDFELSKEDMDLISNMDTGYSKIINHFTAETAKWLNNYKIH